MTAPRRFQRQRTAGWQMPAGAIYVGRPTKWGNPLSKWVWAGFTVEEAVADYRRWLLGEPVKWKGIVAAAEHYLRQKPPALEAVKAELRGRDLVCWCKPGARCHADVLLELANA
jgi:hypothetical protein